MGRTVGSIVDLYLKIDTPLILVTLSSVLVDRTVGSIVDLYLKIDTLLASRAWDLSIV